jgi:hypothetical protein
MKAVNAYKMYHTLDVALSPLAVPTEPIILMTGAHSRYRAALFAVQKRVRHVKRGRTEHNPECMIDRKISGLCHTCCLVCGWKLLLH